MCKVPRNLLKLEGAAMRLLCARAYKWWLPFIVSGQEKRAALLFLLLPIYVSGQRHFVAVLRTMGKGEEFVLIEREEAKLNLNSSVPAVCDCHHCYCSEYLFSSSFSKPHQRLSSLLRQRSWYVCIYV